MPYANSEKYRAYQREYRNKNIEKLKIYEQNWRDNNREKIHKSQKEYSSRIRIAAFEVYGKKCVCCGESDIRFLTLDHINGGGTQHRLRIKQANICKWLKANNYPDGFQTLCYNCNCAKGIYGKCPHETDRRE